MPEGTLFHCYAPLFHLDLELLNKMRSEIFLCTFLQKDYLHICGMLFQVMR